MNRTQELRKILWLLVLTTTAVQLTALTGLSKSPLSTVKTSFEDGEVFLSFALVGTCLIHLWTRPRWSEVWATIGFGILINAGLAWLRGSPDRTLERLVMTSGYGFGSASFAVLAVQALGARGGARASRLATLMAGSVIPIYVVLVEFFLRLTYFHTKTWDRLLYAFDDSLGIQFSFLVGRMFMASNLLKTVSLVIYLALPLAFSLLVALQMRQPGRAPVNVMTAFLMVGATGYLLYHIYPAIGPRYMFGQIFPMSTPPAATDHSLLDVFEPLRRNAMPSLHFGWVLILWWNSRWYGRWVQAMAVIFVGFTILGTLGLGEHYLIDLIVAVPFTVAVQAACANGLPFFSASRSNALWGGAGVTLLWFVVIRFGITWFQQSLMISWGCVLGTLAVSLWLEWRLAQASLARIVAVEPPAYQGELAAGVSSVSSARL